MKSKNRRNPQVQGSVRFHPRGFGWLRLDDKKRGESIFLPPDEMVGLLDGVDGHVHGDDRPNIVVVQEQHQLPLTPELTPTLLQSLQSGNLPQLAE